ncbi:MAG: F0F1 ATP synthase subunit B [Eubacteriaceae bacterium]|jgi:F-type H+-transporting ATPase subunit b|nr:F0F1 ATP synthase subunit B [Eubacteriaceae bacterium]
MVELHTGLIELNWSSVMILLNIFILFLIIRKYFWAKLRGFMLQRQQNIVDAIASAEAVNAKADEKMANYDKKIAHAEEEGREIVKQAKLRADANAKVIIEEANEKASNIILQAEKQIDRERQKAMADMKQEIMSLALMAAGKIIEQQINADGEQEKIVDQVIEEAGKSGWQK